MDWYNMFNWEFFATFSTCLFVFTVLIIISIKVQYSQLLSRTSNSDYITHINNLINLNIGQIFDYYKMPDKTQCRRAVFYASVWSVISVHIIYVVLVKNEIFSKVQLQYGVICLAQLPIYALLFFKRTNILYNLFKKTQLEVRNDLLQLDVEKLVTRFTTLGLDGNYILAAVEKELFKRS